MTKEIFASVIESIREQFEKDKDFSYGMSCFLQCEVPVYDTSVLLKSLKLLLSLSFKNTDEVISEIDHYCFFQNFGRVETNDEVVIETPEAFYDRLMLECN